MTSRIPLSSRTLALGLLGALAGDLAGCRAEAEADGGATGVDGPTPTRRPAAGTGETGGTDEAAHEPPPPEPDDPRAAALTIARASAPAEVAGEGTKSLGFNLAKISHLFALAATAKVPAWGAAAVAGGEAKLARDDDLDTAWRCEHGGAKPCVLGLALPEPAKVEALRVYTAGGPRFRDYTAHPRVAKVRVHTAAGWVEAELADGASHAYVRFAGPIETQTLAIEIVDVHPGKADAVVQIAEVEVYGTDGAPRQPIELDPDYAWLSWETTTWAAGGDGHTIRQVFVNFAQPGVDGAPPSSKRLFRATGVFGRGDDDYLLFERLHATDCAEHRGSYVLFDKRNRMFYPLGDLGGAGAEVYRHERGRGFAVGWVADGQFTVEGVVEEAGELVWKRPPKLAPADQGRALLREWGFEPTPMVRARPLTATIPGCHRAAAAELRALTSAAPLAAVDPAAAADWLVCSVGADTLYASAPCEAKAQAYLVHDGALAGQHLGDRADARGLRVRRVGDRMLVELSASGGDTSTLLWAEPGQLVSLAELSGLFGASLFLRPPAACSECSDAWARPPAPIASPPTPEPTDTGALPDIDD